MPHAVLCVVRRSSSSSSSASTITKALFRTTPTTHGRVRMPQNGPTHCLSRSRKRNRYATMSWRGFATLSTEGGSSGSSDSRGNNNKAAPTKPPSSPTTPSWLGTLLPTQRNQPLMDPQRAYRYLELETFSEEELKDRFRAILQNRGGGSSPRTATHLPDAEEPPETPASPSTLSLPILRSYLSEMIRREEEQDGSTTNIDDDARRDAFLEAETQRLWRLLLSSHRRPHHRCEAALLSEREFVDSITATASSLDTKRLGPLAASMVMIGLSVGVTTPAFPFVIQNLGLTTGDYGMVVSAFALTKLLGNIPFAVLVEKHGRKPYLVYSLIAISTGVGGIGLAGGFEELYACRLITGLGVAGLSTAATMSVTDISTPLNRASSFAPIGAGFAAGTAMGPALGGMLIDELGVNPTFYLVGGSFLMLGGINSVLLDETMKTKARRLLPWQPSRKNSRAHASGTGADAQQEDPETIQQAFRSALGQWAPLLSEAPVRNVCIINGFYWVALAGSQMTLLPLLLTDPHGLAMTATQVGYVYMGMSFVQVVGNPIFARVVDRVGTVPGIVGGCTMISTAMYALPSVSGGAATDPLLYWHMAAVLGLWAAGSSLLSTAPIAHIGNTVDDARRAQAIALLRTAGDVGFLVGASSMGWVSDLAGSLESAMQSSAAIPGTATSWYVARNLLTSRLKAEDDPPKTS